jgi:hypothetical protein
MWSIPSHYKASYTKCSVDASPAVLCEIKLDEKIARKKGFFLQKNGDARCLNKEKLMSISVAGGSNYLLWRIVIRNYAGLKEHEAGVKTALELRGAQYLALPRSLTCVTLASFQIG